MIVVVMGVSGAGKTTIGSRLAEALGAAFVEGDAFHPPANVAKMRAGVALTDEDRRPWLAALAEALARHRARGEDVVLACSALTRRYRAALRAGPEAIFVHLDGAPDLIAARLRARPDHYMPASLLASQLAILEPPGADERGCRIDAALAPEEIVALLLGRLGRAGAA